jgi:hypothetical protein
VSPSKKYIMISVTPSMHETAWRSAHGREGGMSAEAGRGPRASLSDTRALRQPFECMHEHRDAGRKRMYSAVLTE